MTGYVRTFGMESSGAGTDRVGLVLIVGALLRRDVRALLDSADVEWTEHKGILESSFAVKGPRSKLTRIARDIEAIS